MSNPIVKTLFKHKDDYYKKKENGSYNKITKLLIKNNSRNLYSINGLPQKYRVKNLNNENEHCSICLDVFLKEEYPSVVSLDCGHAFHKICIEGAFKTKKECPDCRAHMSDPKNLQNILGRNLNKPLKNIVYRPIMTFRGHWRWGWVNSVAYSHDGLRIASGSEDKCVRVWDAMSGARVATLQGHSESVRSVAYSPDGRYIASGSQDKSVKVWDATTGKCVATLEGHSYSVTSVAYSPDGRYIASGSYDIRVWDAESRSCVATLEWHSGKATSVAYSPDGKYIASGLDDKTIKIWEFKKRWHRITSHWKCIKTLKGHTSDVNSVAYSPNGLRIASGSSDKSVKVWDAMSGSCLKTLEGHSEGVTSVAYSPDGRRIASAGGTWDDSVRVWDAESGAIVATLKGYSYSVMSVAYSRDGRNIASGSSDGEIKIWDVSNLLVQDGGKKNKTTKKEKLIDTFKKSDLVKIAKMNDVSLKMRNDKAKTKLQLFNSLKRKKLI